MPLFVSVMLLLGMLTVPIPVCGFSSEEISTSYCDEVDISLKIQQNRLEVEVPQSGQFAYLIVTFMNSDGGVPDTAQPVQVINGAAVYDFSDKEDGIYYVQLYRSSSEQGTFDGIIGGMESVAVKIENGSGKIIPSSVYDENLTKYLQQAVSADALCYYLKPSVNVQSDNGKIVSKAAEITDGISDPYQKVRSVHDWVASNLYFDYDALSQQGQNWPKDALGALETGRTVCEGYANLTTALLRASGIPAKTMIGYALYGSEHSWNASNLKENRANHAWTAAFADGRWILMDPTWDSQNYYRDGEYHTSEEVHTYFDSTLEFFSYNHRQSRNDFYDSNYMKKEFFDVRNHWAFDSIRFVINNDLMSGTAEDRFDPDVCTTQAMLVTVLHRLSEGAEKSTGCSVSGSGDSGVMSGDWYSGAVEWARQNGILEGIESAFSPEQMIDRQTMSVMLDNYINYSDLASDGPESGGDTVEQPDSQEISFADEDQIAGWASEQVHRMVSCGILQGRSDGTFGPHDFLTRAELASVIERLVYSGLMEELGQQN